MSSNNVINQSINQIIFIRNIRIRYSPEAVNDAAHDPTSGAGDNGALPPLPLLQLVLFALLQVVCVVALARP